MRVKPPSVGKGFYFVRLKRKRWQPGSERERGDWSRGERACVNDVLIAAHVELTLRRVSPHILTNTAQPPDPFTTALCILCFNSLFIYLLATFFCTSLPSLSHPFLLSSLPYSLSCHFIYILTLFFNSFLSYLSPH